VLVALAGAISFVYVVNLVFVQTAVNLRRLSDCDANGKNGRPHWQPRGCGNA